MASRKNNQETSKQSTLLRWVRPDREPSKTENRGEQAGDARLNHLMTLHVHRDRTDSIDLVAAANQFVGEQENRKQLFGSFTTNDLSRKVSLVSRSTQTSL